MNSRRPWLWMIIAINIIAALMIYESGELVGDLAGSQLFSKTALLLASILIISSYLVVLGPAFERLMKIEVRGIIFGADNSVIGHKVGKFLVVLQVSYLIFTMFYGVNIAGSGSAKTTSVFSVFFVLVPPDALFLIYYGLYRENRYFYPNLAIWVTSSLSRGWAGMFLAIMFLEWCRASYKSKNIKYYAGIGATLVILLYPIIASFKWLRRADPEAGFFELAGNVGGYLSSADYLELIQEGITHLITRIQSVSMLLECMRLKDSMQSAFDLGEFAPFWKEGLHGVIYDRLFVEAPQQLIGVVFTQYMDTRHIVELGDWNVSLGWVSWFFIAPEFGPLYFMYTLLLCYMSIYIIKKIGSTKLSEDVLWYTWFAYLLAPWFSVFIGFIYALFVFLLIKIIASVYSEFSMAGKKSMPV